ncbi:MAG: hypothetical protein OXH59_10770 [Rhodospirillaceae bacterium]|nr:hypothetical protein [Rhodospirillaceae bacterium]
MPRAVEASLKGEIGRAFGKPGDNIAEVKPDNIAGAAAASWLRLAPLIETTFREAHIMVTKMRNDMLDEDRGDELDELVADARAFQNELLGREPVEGSGGE